MSGTEGPQGLRLSVQPPTASTATYGKLLLFSPLVNLSVSRAAGLSLKMLYVSVCESDSKPMRFLMSAE